MKVHLKFKKIEDVVIDVEKHGTLLFLENMINKDRTLIRDIHADKIIVFDKKRKASILSPNPSKDILKINLVASKKNKNNKCDVLFSVSLPVNLIITSKDSVNKCKLKMKPFHSEAYPEIEFSVYKDDPDSSSHFPKKKVIPFDEKLLANRKAPPIKHEARRKGIIKKKPRLKNNKVYSTKKRTISVGLKHPNKLSVEKKIASNNTKNKKDTEPKEETKKLNSQKDIELHFMSKNSDDDDLLESYPFFLSSKNWFRTHNKHIRRLRNKLEYRFLNSNYWYNTMNDLEHNHEKIEWSDIDLLMKIGIEDTIFQITKISEKNNSNSMQVIDNRIDALMMKLVQ